MPLALDDEMLDRVMAGAAMLPQHMRDGFLKSVAGRVAGLPRVGLAEIETAISFVLANYGVSRNSRTHIHRTDTGSASDAWPRPR